MSNDDDDAGGSSHQQSLDNIMLTCYLDDLGTRDGMVQRILGYCQTWRDCRSNSSVVGHTENLATISVASPKAESAK